MKALFISNDPHIFLPESAARGRMRAYASFIGELHVVSTARRDAAEVHEPQLHLYPVRAPRIFRTFMLARRARKVIKERGIEIVSAQDPFEHGRAALHAARGTSAKVHVQIHTDFLSPHFTEGSFKNRVRARIADKVLPKADGIRAVSERVKQSVMARYGDRIVEPSVIPVHMNAALPLPAALPEHTFTYTFIAVGRLEKEKRYGDMLEALRQVRLKYQNTGVFIFGDGRERNRLMKEAASLGLARNAIFFGHRADARRYLESGHAFIQTSAYEGYGVSLIEAALARKPIVTTDVGLVGEVLNPKNDALVCPVGDVACLVRQMSRLIEDNPLRKLLADSAEISAKAHLAAIGNIPERIAADLAATVSQA